MQEACKCPVIVDCTHSLQQPNTAGGVTGGCPEMIETIARAAVVTGADGIFMETHPDPANAKSDGANMLRLDLRESLHYTCSCSNVGNGCIAGSCAVEHPEPYDTGRAGRV